MGKQVCDCGVGPGNSGYPSCVPIMGVDDNIILVPTFKEDGTENKIDLSTATLDQTFFEAQVNNVNRFERWYPMPGSLKNVTSERGDPLQETFNDGTIAKIDDGPRTYLGDFINIHPTYLKKINNQTCIEMSYYKVTKQGNLVGNAEEDGFLKPIRIAKDTLDLRYVDPTDTTTSKVRVSFQVHQNEFDGDIQQILASEMTFDVRDLRGLLDVIPILPPVSTSTTTIEVDLTICYGSAKTKQPFEGAVLGDFSLFNKSTVAALPIISVTEATPGRYLFTFAAQTLLDVIEVSMSKTGFELEPFDVTL